MSLLTSGWLLLTKRGELHFFPPSLHPSTLPPPPLHRWLMDGTLPPPHPPSILFDKQHNHLKQRRHFNHSLNRVFLCKAMQPPVISQKQVLGLKCVTKQYLQHSYITRHHKYINTFNPFKKVKSHTQACLEEILTFVDCFVWYQRYFPW